MRLKRTRRLFLAEKSYTLKDKIRNGRLYVEQEQ